MFDCEVSSAGSQGNTQVGTIGTSMVMLVTSTATGFDGFASIASYNEYLYLCDLLGISIYLIGRPFAYFFWTVSIVHL